MPIHQMNLHKKPSEGGGFSETFLKSYQAYNYRHKIAAVGGFDTASCDLVISPADSYAFLEQYLGNKAEFFVDNPHVPIWEGLINRIMFQIANVQFTASLDQLFNRVQVQYATAADATNITTASDDTDSQAIYGIKQGVIDGLVAYQVNTPNALRNVTIENSAWPRISTVFGSGGGVVLSIELVGLCHTLEWELYADATSASVNASVQISNIIAALANGTTFFDNSDTSLITTNTGFTPNRLVRTGQTAWQALQAVQEGGDGVDDMWVMGITPTDPNTSVRRFYYRPANTAIEYAVRLSDGMRVTNLYGNEVKAWEVQPDRGIRITDTTLDWGGVIGDDPRESYLEVIEYDGETQAVSWQTSDNIEIEGAMQLRKLYKTRGSRFGAVPMNNE